MSESTIALFGLIGAAIGAIPGLLGVVIPWLRNRDEVAQAMRNLDLANKEVQFISSWFEAASGIADEEELRTLKQEAKSRLTTLMATSKEASAALVSSEIAERKRKPARKGHMFLFIYAGFFAFVLFGASVDDQGNISLSYFLDEVTSEDGSIGVAVLGIPLIWLIWRWYRSGRAAT